ncbi:MAG: hypothetical protein MUF03_14435 [Rubrivivax sp.]|jgi:hypothetical protein|nr:hypothetical protein [Rubrivivax sp.]
MKNPSLQRVTRQTLANYRGAAVRAVGVGREGGHRIVTALDGAVERALKPAARIVPRGQRPLETMRRRVHEVALRGIDGLARGTEQAIDAGSGAAGRAIDRLARLAQGVESTLAQSGLEVAARWTLPGAQVALAISGKVAEGAEALAGAVGVRKPRRAATRTSRSTATATRKAATRKRARPVTGDAAKVVKAVRTRAARAAAQVVEAVAAEVKPTPARKRRAASQAPATAAATA